MRFNKTLKISVIILCFIVAFSMLASCRGEENNSEAEKTTNENSESVSYNSEVSDNGSGEIVGTSSDVAVTDDPASDGLSSEESASEDSSVDEPASDDSSVDEPSEPSSDEPADSSSSKDDTSSDQSADNSGDNSSDTSSDVSEEDQFEEFIKKYENLESVKAIVALEKQYSEKMCVNMTGNVSVMGYKMEYVLVSYMDGTGEQEKSMSSGVISFMGETQKTKELTIGDVTYLINDDAKIYCVEPKEENSSDTAGVFFDENITVETKNELIEGEIYTADWFVSTEGEKIGLYTKNGELRFMCLVLEDGDMVMEMLFELEFSDDLSGAEFEIPDGYSLVDYESFEGWAVL